MKKLLLIWFGSLIVFAMMMKWDAHAKSNALYLHRLQMDDAYRWQTWFDEYADAWLDPHPATFGTPTEIYVVGFYDGHGREGKLPQ